jgi:hypothetical protein
MVSVTSLARLQEAFGALDLRLDERTSMRLDLVSA